MNFAFIDYLDSEVNKLATIVGKPDGIFIHIIIICRPNQAHVVHVYGVSIGLYTQIYY